MIGFVPLDISLYLRNPIVGIGRRPNKSRTVVLVPETSVYKDARPVFS